MFRRLIATSMLLAAPPAFSANLVCFINSTFDAIRPVRFSSNDNGTCYPTIDIRILDASTTSDVIQPASLAVAPTPFFYQPSEDIGRICNYVNGPVVRRDRGDDHPKVYRTGDLKCRYMPDASIEEVRQIYNLINREEFAEAERKLVGALTIDPELRAAYVKARFENIEANTKALEDKFNEVFEEYYYPTLSEKIIHVLYHYFIAQNSKEAHIILSQATHSPDAESGYYAYEQFYAWTAANLVYYHRDGTITAGAYPPLDSLKVLHDTVVRVFSSQ